VEKTASLVQMKEKEFFREKNMLVCVTAPGFLRRTFLLNTPENLCRSTGLPFVPLEVIRGALYL
jgi:hypothetical protein